MFKINSRYTSAFLAVGKRWTLDIMCVTHYEDGTVKQNRLQVEEASFDSFIAEFCRQMPEFSRFLVQHGLDKNDRICNPGINLGGLYEYDCELYTDIAALVSACNMEWY